MRLRRGLPRPHPGFFETQRIPLVAGREFESSGDDLPDGLIINHVLAERLWPQRNPVGETVIINDDVERRITGVVALDRCVDLLGERGPCAWQPFPNGSTGYLRIRTRGAPLELVQPLRTLVRELSPDVAVYEENTLSAILDRSTATHRASALASSALALVGIILMAVSCVSLFLSMVRGSAREISIRMALGATPVNLTQRIMTQGLALAIPGVVLGVALALVVASRLADQFVAPQRPNILVFVVIPLFVGLVGMGSVLYSAVKAARTEPLVYL